MENKKDLVLPVIALASSVFILGIFGIAVSAIATECYDKNPTFKTDNQNNYGYIIFVLVMNILMIFSASSSVAFVMQK